MILQLSYSRPLAPLDTLAADGIAPLTPGHFLIEGTPAALPSKPDIDFKSTYGKCWGLVEHMHGEMENRVSLAVAKEK